MRTTHDKKAEESSATIQPDSFLGREAKRQRKEREKDKARKLKLANDGRIIFDELRKTALPTNGSAKKHFVVVKELEKRLGLTRNDCYRLCYRARRKLVKKYKLYVKKQTGTNGRILRYVNPGTTKSERIDNEKVWQKDLEHILSHVAIAGQQLNAMNFRNQLPENRTAQYKKLSAVSNKFLAMGELLSGTAEEIKEEDQKEKRKKDTEKKK